MIPLLCVLLLALDSPGSLTLEEALRLAHEANAKLPPAALERDSAEEKIREARAERWMKVAIDGDFIYAPPGGYDPAVTNGGDARLQLTAKQPLLDGGAHRAAIARATADRDAAVARYRVAEKDLDVEVTSRFAELVEAGDEAQVRLGGLERLRRYRTTLESRKSSGQAVAADLLKTDVRIASDEADRIDAEARAEEARTELNVLMGRAPDAPLSIVAPTIPAPGPPGSAAPAAASPEVREAEALARGADADVLAAQAERKPHLFASADAGWWGSDTTRWSIDRWKQDAGFSLGVQVSWLLWDFGASDARIARARIEERRARLEIAAREREAGLQRAKARAAAEALRRQIDVLSRAEPAARDSWLQAESRYRGGAAPALEVIDAYAAAVDASIKLAQAESRLRIAEALEKRWETP